MSWKLLFNTKIQNLEILERSLLNLNICRDRRPPKLRKFGKIGVPQKIPNFETLRIRQKKTFVPSIRGCRSQTNQ